MNTHTIGALAVAGALLGGSAGPASAQELQLSIREGRVTLLAHQVPPSQILAEWARVGDCRIVNGDKLAGPPLTLQLVDVPERQALDTVLRSAAGYMVAPRALDSDGSSVFDRILILPESRAPAVTAMPAARPTPLPMARPQPLVGAPDDSPAEPEADDPQAQPVPPFTLPGLLPGPGQVGVSPVVPGDSQEQLPAPFPGPFQGTTGADPNQPPPVFLSPVPGASAPQQPPNTPQSPSRRPPGPPR